MDSATAIRGGRILIADDEKTFLYATADLLRDEGYQCDCAVDAATAAEQLRDNRYDLLISDIKMPGNSRLELIHQLPKLAPGMPVILVTGYPEMDTATEAVGLPVVAYLPKPLNLDDALEKVEYWIQWSERNRTAAEACQRLTTWCRELCKADTTVQNAAEGDTIDPAKAIHALRAEDVTAALEDLACIGSNPAIVGSMEEEVGPSNWIEMQSMRSAIGEAIEVLKRTKGAFKSKQLGQLRRKLENMMGDWQA